MNQQPASQADGQALPSSASEACLSFWLYRCTEAGKKWHVVSGVGRMCRSGLYMMKGHLDGFLTS